ncbi:porin family protein [Vibrio sp. V39_P1S14PM300]|uniref:porin family protein n=1 Tax=Vibrio sp. V39_P1S14PM300 TaxID=1938690 RepID=UPI0013731EC0|nr:outer membrane beta-barrel protein [Vibrio sp. V39_P1S14PM300]NAX23258.1 outer membrane beta-barrel protein [Vibrio sp. V39_P1S14PM300]
MKSTILTLTGLLSLATFSTLSYAADSNDNGVYVGANYGYLKVDGQDDFDNENDVMQGLVGYRFNQYLAVEGGYINFGKYGSSVANAKTDGYTAGLKVTAPVMDRVDVYAKGGQLWYTTDYDVAGLSGSEDDQGVFAGAGVGFKVTDNLLVNVEYTWYDVELNAKDVANGADTETDLKQASLGVEYRF